MQKPDLHNIAAPCVLAFDLPLADGSILAISEIVRVVPNKRLVCKAFWNNQAVYAKLFIGANAIRYAQRDEKGVQALVNANIATPDLLFSGNVELYQKPANILIFKAIAAQNVDVLYEHLLNAQQKPARLQLILQLTRMVALMHKANLQQTDLYFKNFLLDGDKLYAIDGDGIQAFSTLFKKRQKQRNLATLLSKLDGLDTGWIEDCYAYYCKLTATEYLATDYAELYALTQKIRQKTANSYADKKVFRTCTDVKVSQNFNQFTALSSDFGAKNLNVNQLDSALDNPQNRLKSGNTCTVGSTDIANQQVVIKRYNIKNFWHGLKLGVSKSRAAKSWANAHRLTILNIATAKPLALIEARFGWIKRRAYFVSANIDAPDIAEFFASNIDLETKQKVAHETALLFYKLNLLQISHGDCKASNIKIVDNKPVLIDLDSMQSHTCAWWFEKKQIKDLKRLMQNWANNPETSAIFKQAFVQAYDEIDDYLLPTILERAKIA